MTARYKSVNLSRKQNFHFENLFIFTKHTNVSIFSNKVRENFNSVKLFRTWNSDFNIADTKIFTVLSFFFLVGFSGHWPLLKTSTIVKPKPWKKRLTSKNMPYTENVCFIHLIRMLRSLPFQIGSKVRLTH